MDKKTESLENEAQVILQRSLRYVSLYQLDQDDFKDITQEILNDPEVEERVKQAILTYSRRIFVFRYRSDGYWVKGFLSYVQTVPKAPLLLYLRGGNRIFGLPHPATDISCCHPFHTLATLYRGGISEGKDEYGGEDVHDVYNLINQIPELEEKLQISLKPTQKFALGASRGAMQLFLTLGRYPELQKMFKKAVSLSGLLDLKQTLVDRPDLKEMFINDYGLIEGHDDQEWIQKRDPMHAVESIRKDLPFLIIQGQEDNRALLAEGLHMVEKLKKHGNPVTYWEIEGGNHCLANQIDRMIRISEWLNN